MIMVVTTGIHHLHNLSGVSMKTGDTVATHTTMSPDMMTRHTVPNRLSALETQNVPERAL